MQWQGRNADGVSEPGPPYLRGSQRAKEGREERGLYGGTVGGALPTPGTMARISQNRQTETGHA